MRLALTYFNFEARAEPVRLALALGGIPFEDKRVEFAEWQGLKPKTPFGQLPVLSIDDGPFRAQSLALLRWVGSELAPQLYPKNQLLDIEEALGVLDDFDKARNPALSLNSFPEKYGHAHNWHKTEEGQATIKALREKVVSETLPKYASFLEAMLSKNDNQWLASKDSPTLADCVAVPFLRSFTLGHLDHIPVDSLDKYPVLVEYVKRFCSLPQIHGRYSKGLY